MAAVTARTRKLGVRWLSCQRSWKTSTVGSTAGYVTIRTGSALRMARTSRVVMDDSRRSATPEESTRWRNAFAMGVDVSTLTISASPRGSTLRTGQTVTCWMPTSRATLATAEPTPAARSRAPHALGVMILTHREEPCLPDIDLQESNRRAFAGRRWHIVCCLAELKHRRLDVQARGYGDDDL